MRASDVVSRVSSMFVCGDRLRACSCDPVTKSEAEEPPSSSPTRDRLLPLRFEDPDFDYGTRMATSTAERERLLPRRPKNGYFPYVPDVFFLHVPKTPTSDPKISSFRCFPGDPLLSNVCTQTLNPLYLYAIFSYNISSMLFISNHSSCRIASCGFGLISYHLIINYGVCGIYYIVVPTSFNLSSSLYLFSPC